MRSLVPVAVAVAAAAVVFGNIILELLRSTHGGGRRAVAERGEKRVPGEDDVHRHHDRNMILQPFYDL